MWSQLLPQMLPNLRTDKLIDASIQWAERRSTVCISFPSRRHKNRSAHLGSTAPRHRREVSAYLGHESNLARVSEAMSQDRLAMFNDYQLNGREGETRAGTEGKFFGIGGRHPDFSQ